MIHLIARLDTVIAIDGTDAIGFVRNKLLPLMDAGGRLVLAEAQHCIHSEASTAYIGADADVVVAGLERACVAPLYQTTVADLAAKARTTSPASPWLYSPKFGKRIGVSMVRAARLLAERCAPVRCDFSTSWQSPLPAPFSYAEQQEPIELSFQRDYLPRNGKGPAVPTEAKDRKYYLPIRFTGVENDYHQNYAEAVLVSARALVIGMYSRAKKSLDEAFGAWLKELSISK